MLFAWLQASDFRLQAGLRAAAVRRARCRVRRAEMSRDYRKLSVFHQADELIHAVYAGTAIFPREERFNLCAQVRRSAVSVATNIVEGCARRTTREYLHFINIATGSAAETLYLLDLSYRLGFVTAEVYREFDRKYNHLLAGLQKLQHSLENDA
jgi:four helix bundle protein